MLPDRVVRKNVLRLQKFVHTKRADQVLLVQAALLLAAVRVSMFVLPFHSLRSLVDWAAQPPLRLRRTEQMSVGQIAWAINVASDYVPRAATCLPRALAGQVLLGRYGFPAQVHIGIARAANGLVEGHAWVESEGSVVIGGSRLDHFTPIAAFEKGSI
jgi:Transglutaminase-like superfamily